MVLHAPTLISRFEQKRGHAFLESPMLSLSRGRRLVKIAQLVGFKQLIALAAEVIATFDKMIARTNEINAVLAS